MITKCKSCNEPILWARTVSGKSIPLDSAPSPKGNLILKRVRTSPQSTQMATIAVIATKEQRLIGKAGGLDLYLSHYATCRDAARWRRRERKEPTEDRRDK